MKPETRREVEEALRSSQDLLAFLWNNIDPSGEGGTVEITADDDAAVSIANMLTDARERLDLALHALELDPPP